MKRILLIPVFILFISYSYGSGFLPCRLIFNDGNIRVGLAKTPDMSDKTVKFKENTNSITTEISSDDLYEIIYTEDSVDFKYEKVLTYKNYGNKKVNKTKSWLKVLKTGYLNFYYGYEPGMGNPSSNMWYFKKTTDTIAYFITMKYSGGLVMTIGTANDFRKNASFYLADYVELADKIQKSEYKFEDIELVVDLYNEWLSKN